MAVPTSGSPELSAWPHRNAFPQERHARGLDAWGLCLGHARAHATQPGHPDLGVAHPSRGLGEGRYGNCLHVKGDS